MDNENIEPTEEQVEAEMLASLQESEVEEILEEEVEFQPCKHIFQGRCQLHNVEADEKCRCSRYEE